MSNAPTPSSSFNSSGASSTNKATSPVEGVNPFVASGDGGSDTGSAGGRPYVDLQIKGAKPYTG